jgi:P-type E1-E2 ATPase
MRELGLRADAQITLAIAAANRLGSPLVCIGWAGQVRSVFVFCEQEREEAYDCLASLQAAGLSVSVLTGDYGAGSTAMGQSLDIAIETQLLPEDKLGKIQLLRAQHGPVAMVGDGINDAPALAEADVGIALSCGADVSREAADVCLMGDDLARIPWCYALAKRTVRTMRQNLLWAFAYNSAGIALAAMGWLNPIWAAVAMVGSSLFVVANSLQLAAMPLETGPTQDVPCAPAELAAAKHD